MITEMSPRTAGPILFALLLVLGGSPKADAQGQPGGVPAGAASTVIRDVTLVPMDAERLLPHYTVVVRGDRIVDMGPSDAIVAPPDALVIDGTGKFLTPGLADAHVHLSTDMPWAPARPDFGDAPLYLAYGVTTVVNLRGDRSQLEWRDRIAAGEMAGPTIYTAGEFVNEPRVTTAEEVRREVMDQARAGFDLIKFHEAWAPGVGFTTTTGLSRDAYMAMVTAAREAQLPLVGHAPVNLGLETMLEASQSVAHVGMLSNIYFLPLASHPVWLALTAGSFIILVALALMSVTAAIVRRGRPGLPRLSRTASRLQKWAAFQVLIGAVAILDAAWFLPGGSMFDSTFLRIVFTALAVLLAVAATVGSALTIAAWRDSTTPASARAGAAVASLAGLLLACCALVFWLSIVWRSSDAGIERLVSRIREADISVQSTLVAYDVIGGPGRRYLTSDPAIAYLRKDTQSNWHAVAGLSGPPGYRYTDFMKKVTGALHRGGVRIVAGTDAMGVQLVTPGSSLHRELELLVESGLTRYDALRAATVAPAAFLGRSLEFGSVAIGRRADLLLVEGNPLEDLSRLRQPAGVMARGRWYTREDLQGLLHALE